MAPLKESRAQASPTRSTLQPEAFPVESTEVLSPSKQRVFVPPPYLVGHCDRAPPAEALLAALDARLTGLPLLRSAGDHFLMVMERRSAA